ncbi:hypothetical protein N865_10585 [Intrasporangium oryzae NRRL B-24470]|uniref:Uncharacterized protein n=1 Tax=Intrasporangium oryzae NRRL B-24470 TaxID=1386089 RepID=W9G5Y2_9MICO|nr:hypothetical protein N865_10585 [Intrasporangium oryzae NRRL B-24470]
MHRTRLVRLAAVTAPAVVVAALAIPSLPAQAASQSIGLAGTSSIVTGDSPTGDQGPEFPAQEEENGTPDAFTGTITDRTLSLGHAPGKGVSVNSGKKAKSNPTFSNGFEGLNLYQQRYARRGNQFTVEPPDQAMCVGGGYVMEAVNDVVNVYNTGGQSVLPDNTATNIVSGFPRNVNHAVDLNSFYGYPPAIIRTTGVRGPELTDPTCIYDAATQRFFMVVLTIDPNSSGTGYVFTNHLDLAVSKTSDPTGLWNIYKIDVTNDGTNAGGVNPCPCLGDYPHIGADANGIYLTTNAYPWQSNGFDGAQIYALSKAQLAAGAANVTMQHIDTFGTVNAPSQAGSTQPGFTVWPAQSPGTGSFNLASNGTEYFLSSNAADEATHPITGSGGTYESNQLVVWSLTNTASLASGSADVHLANRIIDANQYALPPKQQQPGSGTAPGTGTPQGHCINDTTTLLFTGQTGCWRLLVGPPPHNEVVSAPDSNDTRMQQVTYANGKLWGALDTAVTVGGSNRAGIGWYVVKPGGATLAPKMAMQGYLGATGMDFTYPAIGVTASGRGVMAFTATGDATYPSAAYAPIDAVYGVGDWNVVPGGDGMATDDGFTGYRAQLNSAPRPRWGDYGAAAVDGSKVWVASEYISGACDYTTWGGPFFAGGTGDNLLGTCAGPDHGPGLRTALGNWSTRVSSFVP